MAIAIIGMTSFGGTTPNSGDHQATASCACASTGARMSFPTRCARAPPSLPPPPPCPTSPAPCAACRSPVTFKWKGEAQGVFQIPSADCPDSFDGPQNDTFQELQPVSDDPSFSTAGYPWSPPCTPGSYFLTSQVPGACEAGAEGAAGPLVAHRWHCTWRSRVQLGGWDSTLGLGTQMGLSCPVRCFVVQACCCK